MLNKALEVTLNDAFRYAKSHRHEFMTVEHLLVALLDNKEAKQALTACSADFDRIRLELTEFISQTTPHFPEDAEDSEVDTQPTLGFQRVLQRAVFHVQSSGQQEVTGANVLVAIFSEQESHAVYVLKSFDISRLDVVNYISHGVEKDSSAPEIESEEQQSVEPEKESTLDSLCINLN
jgi:ATP-dependent Clp protease ATP-binding subunit ClpA